MVLGNPGRKYSRTRHNIGFMALDAFWEPSKNFSVSVLNTKHQKGLYKIWKIHLYPEKQEWLLCAPLTFVNLSGNAVIKLKKKYAIASDQIIVVHDELDLSLGKLKFKYGGGLSGHKGLISVAEQIGTRDFYRLRLGIGRPFEGRDVFEHVLSEFHSQEKERLDWVLKSAAQGIYLFCTQGIEKAMNTIHSK